MGQSYSSAVAVDSVGISIPEFADVVYERQLSSARFLKTIRGRTSNGLLAIKVFGKVAGVPLDKYYLRILCEQEALQDIPNAFTYEQIIETPNAGYLVRQYLYSTLYDRISTRPFLENIEKKWIAFQLLCGLRDCHAQGVHHGDIKTENVFVTSWNWIYLSDFASFKPAYLPEDNPADFSYYFDTSGRRVCYIAPERFSATSVDSNEGATITDAMDIFSLGCVIAELFLDGTPLFTLSQLFKYRSGEFDPTPYLNKIEDKEIRILIKQMIKIVPNERSSAENYLRQWRNKGFPEYFYNFLHGYIELLTDPTAGRRPATLNARDLISRADYRINNIYHDFDKISYFLGFNNDCGQSERTLPSTNSIIPVHLDIPEFRRHSAAVRKRPSVDEDGGLLFLSIIAASMRTTALGMPRVRACDLILAFAERMPDDLKMDRCLPYLASLLNDKCAFVRVAALRSVSQLLDLVEVISPVDSDLFPAYLLPKLQEFPSSETTAIRASYASCIASLATSASRFLDMTQALRADGALPTADPEAEVGTDKNRAFYDTSRLDLTNAFADHSKLLLADPDPSVRRAFLKSVSRLCVFFGPNKANDIILSHLNTYLNDRDWMLRCAFFETITGVATFVGGAALEEYIMPLMVQSLADPEEFVVEKVLRSLAHMAELGLFQRSKIWELIEIVGRFTMHPNIWLREAAAAFISGSTKWLSPADIHCIVLPLVKQFLRSTVVDLTGLNILDNLKRPLSRTVFDMAVTWASQSKESGFWHDAQGQKSFIFGHSPSDLVSRFSSVREMGGSLRSSRNKEDVNWLNKLRNLGMTTEDEWKVFILREYIWRMAKSKPRLLFDSTPSTLNNVISLQDIGITPLTIFFDDRDDFFSLPISKPGPDTSSKGNSTIADALLDASKTIDHTPRRSPSQVQLRRIASDLRRPRNGGSLPPSGAVTPTAANPEHSVVNDTASGSATPLAVPTVKFSEDEASPVSSSESKHGLRHKPSLVSLLNGRSQDSNKAAAETGTVSTNAFGKVELPFVRRNEPKLDLRSERAPAIFRGAHTYEGSDPHVLELLNSMYLQGYPSDIIEFGPTIVPLQRKPIQKGSGKAFGNGLWKPEISLVAQYGEHTAAINRIIVAPDHRFFLTGSDDGTVKIWDATRIEKNVAFKSRQTYKHATPSTSSMSAVKALCWVENTRCFISGGIDGSIHVVKINYTPPTKYGKLQVMRNWKLPVDGEYAVWLDHFKADNYSLLLVSTNKSNIYAIDLRTMAIIYKLLNPLHHGTPTCFVVDPRHCWLLVGTSHGILDMWDLRFHLRLKSWGLPGSTPIHKLERYPQKSRPKWIIVAGGTGSDEVSIWDIEKTQCREVCRSARSSPSSPSSPHNTYEPWYPDDSPPEQVLSRFSSIARLDLDRGIRALATGIDTVDEAHGGDRGLSGFIITGGSDRKVRFWHLAKVEYSCVISGEELGDEKSAFTMENVGGGGKALIVYEEKRGEGKEARKRKSSRSSVVSAQQQGLMRSHLDAVLDCAFLERPYGLVISVDRSGMLFVYQ